MLPFGSLLTDPEELTLRAQFGAQSYRMAYGPAAALSTVMIALAGGLSW